MPTARRVVGVDVVLPAAFSVSLSADADATVDVAPTSSAWVWRVLERVAGGGNAYRYLVVPDSLTTIDYAALVEVDPGTMIPVPAPQTVQQLLDAEAALARNADNLLSGTVADARLPVTAQAATLAATYPTAEADFTQPTRHAFRDGFTSRQDPDSGSGGNTRRVIAKPQSDTQPGVVDWANNSSAGYLFHLQTGAPSAPERGSHPARQIGIGLDDPAPDGTSKGVGGILIAHKQNAVGLEINHYATVTGADSYGLYVTQSSAAAPAVRVEQNVDGGAPVFQMVAGVSSASTAKLMEVVVPGGLAGSIMAYSGEISWVRPVKVSDFGATVSYFEAATDGGTPANQRTYTRMRKDSLLFYGYSGSTGTWYPRGWVMNGQDLELRGGANTTDLTSVPASAASVVLKVRNHALAFFGSTPILQPTGTPAAATDLATALTLVNSLRTNLLAFGLVA